MSREVLIVDDSISMRALIASVLTKAGCCVVGEACNGDEAVRCYELLRPDVVTLDIVMPGTSGIQTLVKIMELDPGARVVVISALDRPKLIAEAMRKGAQEFIAKPFPPERLREALRRILPEPVVS